MSRYPGVVSAQLFSAGYSRLNRMVHNNRNIHMGISGKQCLGFFLFYCAALSGPACAGLNVVEKTSSGTVFAPEKYNGIESLSPYYSFSRRHRKEARENVWFNLTRQIKIAAGKSEKTRGVDPRYLTPSKLKLIIAQKLGIDFLLDGFDERLLTVTVLSVTKRSGYVEKALLFSDRHVGDFYVIFLAPDGYDKPLPAVIGLHGHSGTNIGFRDNFMAKELAQSGFTVIIPWFRAMGNIEDEDNKISTELLKNGFTLMGLRVYEALLVHKYLRHLNSVDSSRIGLLTHSGGGGVGCLMLRIAGGVKALVYDSYLPGVNRYSLNNPVHCETLPQLNYYIDIINSGRLSLARRLELPYTYNDNAMMMEKALEFLRANVQRLPARQGRE